MRTNRSTFTPFEACDSTILDPLDRGGKFSKDEKRTEPKNSSAEVSESDLFPSKNEKQYNQLVDELFY